MMVDDIRTALRQAPFQAFSIRLADGRALQVKHPECVLLTRRNLIVSDPETDAITWVDPMLALSLDFAPPSIKSSDGTTPNGPPPAANS